MGVDRSNENELVDLDDNGPGLYSPYYSPYFHTLLLVSLGERLSIPHNHLNYP